jgi:hypothetical protein
MRTINRISRFAIVALAVSGGLAIASTQVSADDARLTATPAVYRVDDSVNSETKVRTVQWNGGYYRPYYGTYIRPYYYGGYNRPYYYGGYYRPNYYGYGYPAYGYGYGYPGYGYVGPGVGIGVGRVGVGIW